MLLKKNNQFVFKKGDNMKTTYTDLINFFSDNADIYEDVIEELDSYDGYLTGERYYPMEDLETDLSGLNPIELINRLSNDFSLNDEWYKWENNYTLISTHHKDYSDYLDSYFINDLLENYHQLYSVDEYPELLEMLENVERDLYGEE